jgi:ElaB/YqjD/DUF883 family membrane-anchored ribosome-binding protein
MNTSKTPVAGTLENLANAAGDRAKSCLDSGVDACHAVSDKALRIGRSANGMVRENPWVAIGLAAGIGATIGFLLGRRSES